MSQQPENQTIVTTGEAPKRPRGRCKLCGKEFSYFQLTTKMPVISHFMSQCPDAHEEIGRLAASLIEIIDENAA